MELYKTRVRQALEPGFFTEHVFETHLCHCIESSLSPYLSLSFTLPLYLSLSVPPSPSLPLPLSLSFSLSVHYLFYRNISTNLLTLLTFQWTNTSYVLIYVKKCY